MRMSETSFLYHTTRHEVAKKDQRVGQLGGA